MKAPASSSINSKEITANKATQKYTLQNYDYQKYLGGRKSRKYGSCSTLVYDESYEHCYFCNAD